MLVKLTTEVYYAYNTINEYNFKYKPFHSLSWHLIKIITFFLQPHLSLNQLDQLCLKRFFFQYKIKLEIFNAINQYVKYKNSKFNL